MSNAADSSDRSPSARSSLRQQAGARLAVALSLVMPMLVGCGGGGGSATTAPPPGETAPGPVLDYSAIAGDWTGDAIEGSGTRFFIDATIQPSAERGATVGAVEYRLEPGGNFDCRNEWLAADSEDPVFVVNEIRDTGTCPPGTVTLELFRGETERLVYSYTPDNGNQDLVASGELTRP